MIARIIDLVAFVGEIAEFLRQALGCLRSSAMETVAEGPLHREAGRVKAREVEPNSLAGRRNRPLPAGGRMKEAEGSALPT